MSFSKASVIGLGYIGLPTAAILASRKIPVIGIDINQAAINLINEGQVHFIEPDLDILVHATVSEGYLRASDTPETADVFIIAVPTPFNEEMQPDLSFIKVASESIAPVLKKGDLVILESTSPVGTTEQMIEWLCACRPDLKFPQHSSDNADVYIAYCPERVLPGHVLRELVQNDRIIGGITPSCSRRAKELYKNFVEGECIITDSRTAEMCKLTENSFRDVNIALANELSIICNKLDINVWELISLANRHPRVNILQPGPGVGGHCIAVDPWFIVAKTPDLARLIRSAREVNNNKCQWVVEKLKHEINLLLKSNPNSSIKDLTVACYGLSFKPNIDDLRGSPALQITKELSRLGINVLVIEPNIDSLPNDLDKNVELVRSLEIPKADFHLILVKHHEFQKLNFINLPNVMNICGL